MTAIDFALAVIKAAKIHEESYDNEAADAAASEAQEARENAPDHLKLYAGLVDYDKFYRIKLLTACSSAGDLKQPVYLLLATSWNDALEWAAETIAKSQPGAV